MAKKNKIFYGWFITILAGLTAFGSNGLLNTTRGTIISELLLVKGWDPSALNILNTMGTVVGLLLPLVGIALTKFGPRKLIVFTTIITAVCLGLSCVSPVPMFFCVVYGLGVSFSKMFNDQLSCFAAVTPWWQKRRGEHIGYVQAFNYAGGMVFPPIVALLFGNFGMYKAMIIMAILLVVITALPQAIWLRDDPSEKGMVADGGADLTEKQKAKAAKNANRKVYQGYRTPVEWNARDAMRTPQVWLLSIVWGAMTLGNLMVLYFGMTHVQMPGTGLLDCVHYQPVLHDCRAVLPYCGSDEPEDYTGNRMCHLWNRLPDLQCWCYGE